MKLAKYKTCRTCGKCLPVGKFWFYRAGIVKRLQSSCKKCAYKNFRKWYIRNKKINNDARWERTIKDAYGMTRKQYEKINQKQEGRCAICRSLPKGKEHRGKRLAVDHCHSTGIVRGLLCDACNRGIGLLKENKKVLQRAILYLSRKSNAF